MARDWVLLGAPLENQRRGRSGLTGSHHSYPHLHPAPASTTHPGLTARHTVALIGRGWTLQVGERGGDAGEVGEVSEVGERRSAPRAWRRGGVGNGGGSEGAERGAAPAARAVVVGGWVVAWAEAGDRAALRTVRAISITPGGAHRTSLVRGSGSGARKRVVRLGPRHKGAVACMRCVCVDLHDQTTAPKLPGRPVLQARSGRRLGRAAATLQFEKWNGSFADRLVSDEREVGISGAPRPAPP